jgi:YVTN family beta-propeller protein
MAGCTRTLTLNQKASGDMPLTQAVYSATADKIFGTRGGWIHTFNAGTGALESSLRFVPNMFGVASIMELGGYLYVGTYEGLRRAAHSILQPDQLKPGVDIFKIDPLTMATTPLGLYAAYHNFYAQNRSYLSGFTSLMTDGTQLMGVYQYNDNPAAGSGRYQYCFKCSVADPVATYKQRTCFDHSTLANVVYDSTNNYLWTCSMDNGEIGWVEWGLSSFSDYDYANVYNQALPCGVCWCPVNQHAYYVQQSPILLKANVAKIAANTWDWVNTGVGDATPINIRYRPFDQQLYIPNWQDNTVTVLDPITDTVSAVKTGFTSPIDVVFTPTKAFAVQDSTVGLLEIT